MRPRIDRYDLIIEFMENNPGFQASPTQMRKILNLNCTKVSMNHYLRHMRNKKQLFEIRGRYYLPHQVPVEAKQ